MSGSSQLLLHLPSTDLGPAFLEYVAEFRAHNEDPFWHPQRDEDIASYVQRLARLAHGEEPGFVRMSSFWFTRAADVVGESRIRHDLPPDLIDDGQIGFAVRPRARGGGIGTRLLAMTLDQARALGHSSVSITCDTASMASARVIAKNGGQLVSRAISDKTGKELDRYVVHLTIQDTV